MPNRSESEWLCLQQSFAKMDAQALWFKLLSIVVWLWSMQSGAGLRLQLCIIALFWLLETLLRTVQQRTEQRLLQLERAITEGTDIGMQWHSDWQQQRKGLINLVSSYLKQAAKPTVAVLYVAITALSIARLFL